MGFFTTSVTGLKTVVTAIGAGVGVWGVINLLEGYGNDKWHYYSLNKKVIREASSFVEALGR